MVRVDVTRHPFGIYVELHRADHVRALTFALTPAYILRWHIGFYPSTVLEVAVALTVAAFAFESWRLGSLPSLRSPFLLPAAIFVVACAISVVVAPDRRAALGIFRAYIIEPIAFFFVVGSVVRTARHALLVLAGLALAGVPFAAVLTAVMFMLCIAQLGPLPILVPAVVWLYWSGESVWGTVLVVWSVLLSTTDSVVRPLLIRRGAHLPLLLLLAGVIGGLIAFGLVGIFLGPVVLAVAYTLLLSWMAEANIADNEIAAPRR